MISRHALYEICVQNPRLLVDLLRAIHGHNPRVLQEDFCGTAALCRRWLRDVPRSRAVAIDLDPEPLARIRKHPRLKVFHADALVARLPVSPRPDVMFVGNFSIGEIHSRPALAKYLRRARSRLAKGGVFVCDTYGGATAFTRGSVTRTHAVPGKPTLSIRYTWQQRGADPLTAMVENAIHFRVLRAGEVIQEFTDAFVYHWRLWSIAELRDAMTDAGFSATHVYAQLPDARDAAGRAHALPITDPADLDDSYIVCVAGRV